MKIDQFRDTRASELKICAERIESVFGGDINTTPIYNAIETLKNDTPTLKNGTTDADYWGYSIEDLKIPVETTNHLKPKTINNKKVELILNMNLVGDYKNWGKLNDPFLDLWFNVVVRGISDKGEHFFCFHIDRHDPNIETEEHHPTYHLQYFNNPNGEDEFDYGSTFHLDTPRIVHYPLDLILGIGFITSNFFPMAFESLLEDGYFTGLYRRYQEKFLKPYFHSISNHWNSGGDPITWDRSKICPSLVV